MKIASFLLPIALTLVLAVAGCSKHPEAGSGGASSSGSDQAAGKADGFPSEPTALTVKWPVGHRFVNRMDLNQTTEIQFPDRPSTRNQETVMSQEYAMTVLADREPAGKELEFQFLATQLDVSMGGRSIISFDSAGESLATSENPMVDMFRKMIGLKLKFYLDASNKVEKVDGLDTFRTTVLGSAPAQARAIMTSMFDQNSFNQMVELGKGLPDRPVAPGDSWNSSTEITMGPLGKVVMVMNYKLDSWQTRENQPCALIVFTGVIRAQDEGGGSGPSGMKAKVQEGTIAGKSWFDYELGMALETDMDQKITAIMTIQLPRLGDKGGGTQNLTTKLNQKITVKLVESSPTTI